MPQLEFNPDKCRESAKQSTNEELLDQVEFFGEWLEREAVRIMESELRGRGVTLLERQSHEKKWRHRVLRDREGWPKLCGQCNRAATVRKLAWAKLFGIVPLFPRPAVYCAEHGGSSEEYGLVESPE